MLQMRIFPELPRKDLTAIENTHTLWGIFQNYLQNFLTDKKANIKTNNSFLKIVIDIYMICSEKFKCIRKLKLRDRLFFPKCS